MFWIKKIQKHQWNLGEIKKKTIERIQFLGKYVLIIFNSFYCPSWKGLEKTEIERICSQRDREDHLSGVEGRERGHTDKW
jgi:hypothetical protein